MKAKFIAVLLLFSVLFVFYPGQVKADTTTVYFPTLGNCYLCKLRIEECVNKLDGIEDVNWDYNTDITTVTYEETITDPFIIMDAIALVGHDTEWYPAPDSSYQTLVGTCCEYERTIDYSNVQIGYLSLMDLWVYPVGIFEPEPLQTLTINPSAGSGIFYISLGNARAGLNYKVSVFSMNGSRTYHTPFSATPNTQIDLGTLPGGQYIIVITEEGRLAARSKIIKL